MKGRWNECLKEVKQRSKNARHASTIGSSRNAWARVKWFLTRFHSPSLKATSWFAFTSWRYVRDEQANPSLPLLLQFISTSTPQSSQLPTVREGQPRRQDGFRSHQHPPPPQRDPGQDLRLPRVVARRITDAVMSGHHKHQSFLPCPPRRRLTNALSVGSTEASLGRGCSRCSRAFQTSTGGA